MENIGQDQISGPSNFKYRVSLQKQVLLPIHHHHMEFIIFEWSNEIDMKIWANEH